MNLPVLNIPIQAANGFETGPRSIRAVRMLRVSLTDRCNFRCVYCMPADGVTWLAKDHLLTFEEIEEVIRAAVDEHGIGHIKLTGGEPTVRQGIVDLVRRLRAIRGIEDLSMTTNGMLLESMAQPLADAGLDRLTVSIDSLNPQRFQQITRTGKLDAVIRGLDASERAGLRPIKVNCVVMRGINDEESADFARLTLERPISVRFIEYMPLGDAAIASTTSRDEGLRVDSSEIGPAGGCGAQDRGKDAFVSEAEVRQRIESELGALEPVDRGLEAGVGPAEMYRLTKGNPRGRIGFISAMSKPFCSTCNRLRLTATGVLRSCLFEGGEVDLQPILRGEGAADRQPRLGIAMSDCVRLRPTVHGAHGNEQMSRIGG